MSLIIDEPTDAQQAIQVLAASSWRSDRVNVLGYGEPGSGKTDFGARFPRPVILDTGENGQLTVKKMLREGRIKQDIPVIRTASFSEVMGIALNPRIAMKNLLASTKFSNYDPLTLVVDNISVLEGWCIDEILISKGKADMEVTEINTLKRRMSAFFRQIWNLDMNTVLLAHIYDGREASKMMKAKDPGVALTGQLAKIAPAAADFFLYFRIENEYDGTSTNETFVAYTTGVTGFPARTRLRGLLPERLVNPSYEDLRKALDALEQNNDSEAK